MEMGAESEVDEDQVMVILGPDANSNVFSLPREIKPLRRTQNRTDAVISHPFTLISQDGERRSPSLDVVQSGKAEMEFLEEITK